MKFVTKTIPQSVNNIVFTLLILACTSHQTQAIEASNQENYSLLPSQPESSLRTTQTPQISNPDGVETAAPEELASYGNITILSESIAPASSAQLSWKPQSTFDSIAAPTPILVLNGANPGPTLCLTGAVHGDEINGIEIIRQVFFGLNPKELSGVLIGIPIVNQIGFQRTSRYLPDRRDLNRYFPGDPKGSFAARIAYTFFNDIIQHCDALVDLHTGSFHRTNVTQLRADMRDEKVAQLVHGFGGMIVLHNEGARGTLRRAALEAGIPAVTLEAGEPMRIQEDVIKDGVERIRTLLTSMGINKRAFFWKKSEPLYLNSRWVRSEQGGLLISKIKIGARVSKGDLLGRVIDPINNVEYPIHSPYLGQVIGMALNQVVMPGYAIYHLGIKTTKDALEIKQVNVKNIDPAETAPHSPSHSGETEDPDKPQFD